MQTKFEVGDFLLINGVPVRICQIHVLGTLSGTGTEIQYLSDTNSHIMFESEITDKYINEQECKIENNFEKAKEALRVMKNKLK